MMNKPGGEEHLEDYGFDILKVWDVPSQTLGKRPVRASASRAACMA
jgi:hypothetical protein